jgi:hypothetical protein
MNQNTTSTSLCHSEHSETRFLSARYLRGESTFSSGVYSGGSSSSSAVCEVASFVGDLTGDFAGGGLGSAQPGHPAAGDAFLELDFPTIRYLRIFSRRFAPSPRIASKSSTLLNAPYDFRIAKIFSAVAGPIPGTCCNSSDVAVLMFTGCAGGFFLANTQVPKSKNRMRGPRITDDRQTMAAA